MRTRGKKFASAEVNQRVSAWIDAEAHSNGTSRSEVVRQAVYHYIEHRKRLKELQDGDLE